MKPRPKLEIIRVGTLEVLGEEKGKSRVGLSSCYILTFGVSKDAPCPLSCFFLVLFFFTFSFHKLPRVCDGIRMKPYVLVFIGQEKRDSSI